MNRDLRHIARVNKDRHFDGKFYFGVKTTGVFCRPSCPSPIAKETNVVYFDSIYEALDQGFRPCLRCQPDVLTDHYHKNTDGVSIVEEALDLIEQGYLNQHSINELAEELHITDRYLRRLFKDQLGLPPVKIARYHKAIFAKMMVLNSDLSITSIVAAAGFNSIRQFNDVFKQVFGMTPSDVRKGVKKNCADTCLPTFKITCDKSFTFDHMLDFYRARAIRGVELVQSDCYSRTFRYKGYAGYFKLSNLPEQNCVELQIMCNDIRGYMPIYHQVRKMLDIDANLDTVTNHLSGDTSLEKGFIKGKVPRLPMAFDPFELVVRAVLGQQITVKAATTIAGRIADRAGIATPDEYPEGLEYYFPDSREMEMMHLENLGITLTRQRTLKTAVEAVNQKKICLEYNQSFKKFYDSMIGLKGFGDWTVNYIAMRGLGMVDAFMASDLGVIKALEKEGKRPSLKEITEMAENWRPYRAYAALCLWNSLK